MDRNSITGFILIFLILMVWQWMVSETPEQIAAREHLQDSIAHVEHVRDSIANLTPIQKEETASAENSVPDSVRVAQASGAFGIFAPASVGSEKTFTLDNDLMRVVFSNKGGIVKEVLIKEHFKIEEDSAGNQKKIPLVLLEDKKNTFEYLLPVRNVSKPLSTKDLYFTAEQTENAITFSAKAANGKSFQQKYTINPGSYLMDYGINFNGLESELNNQAISLNWVNYLDKLELNHGYERIYSTVYFKETEDDTDYCSCSTDDEASTDEKVKWVSNSNQFFNSSLIANSSFRNTKVTTTTIEEEDDDLKKLTTNLSIPIENGAIAMKFYNGPNEFERLREIGHGMEDIVPFGWSIFGTINRWAIRPLFNWLSGFIGSKGIVILVLTVIVKALLYPFTYKMIHSQSKMAVLKPEIAKLREKYKNDSQQAQVETMKLYREYGANPLGGCLPVVLQMPIWFALYRFFPGSIEFRQESFLWATDLSSYDVFWNLPTEIPFLGSHISMFTLLWVILTLAYTWYNSRLVDYSAQPAMKYMQYTMPIFFIFFFNSFASGLTAYLCMSTLFNIGQTVLTKEVIIDSDKIKAELMENKKKPKKKSGFQKRLEEAMKEQQRVQAEQKKKKGKKK